MSLKFWSLRMGWYSSELVNPNGVAVTTCNTMTTRRRWISDLAYFEAGVLLGTRGVPMEKVDSRRIPTVQNLVYTFICKKTTIYTYICARQVPGRAVRCRISLANSQRTC